MTQAAEQSGWTKRWGRTAAVVALAAAVVVPVTAYAADGFNDVANSNIFHDDINWMRDNDVTAGCNPPANDEYCPDETVTREQMAAFMHRLESKGVFLTTDAKAADANLLDGKDSTAFLAKDDTAADADELDGLDGSHYANPIAMASGSALLGTGITVQNGEVARLSIVAPASGDVIARLTSSWQDLDEADYAVLMWIEAHQSGSECDFTDDGDYLQGTVGAASVPGFETTAAVTASLAGAGSDAGVAAGTHEYSLCLMTTTGTSTALDWSGSVEWRAAGTSTTG